MLEPGKPWKLLGHIGNVRGIFGSCLVIFGNNVDTPKVTLSRNLSLDRILEKNKSRKSRGSTEIPRL